MYRPMTAADLAHLATQYPRTSPTSLVELAAIRYRAHRDSGGLAPQRATPSNRPGRAAQAAIERDGAKLTQSRISIIAAFPNGQPPNRHEARRKLARKMPQSLVTRATRRNIMFNRAA